MWKNIKKPAFHFYLFHEIFIVIMTLNLDKKISLEISLEEIEQRLDVIFDSNLDDQTKDFLKEALRALVKFDQLVGAKETTIARLRSLFAKKTEKHQTTNKIPKTPKKKGGRKQGQGNNQIKDYENAEKKEHSLPSDQKAGALCPECLNAKLVEQEKKIYLQIDAAPLAKPILHEVEVTTCANCGASFEANYEGKSSGKYTPSLVAILAITHYLGSMPFYRLEKMQKMLKAPLPRSVQWVLMESLAGILFPIMREIQAQAKEGVQFFTDDTTGKIISVSQVLKKLPKNERKKIHTTGIIAKLQNGKYAVLYFTGIKYSGENMKDLLSSRDSLAPIKIMSDALNQNDVKEIQNIIKFNCLAHGRRKFLGLDEKDEVHVDYILEKLKIPYASDAFCKENNIIGEKRLRYHQEHSRPSMTELKTWLDEAFEKKITEPNSPFGKSIQYMLNHWEKLTGFLKYEDAPLDNNILEGNLRTQVLNRKNWLFYKTENGSLVGDTISAILKTCKKNEIDPLEYLKFIITHANEIELGSLHNEKLDEKFLPWNFVSIPKSSS